MSLATVELIAQNLEYIQAYAKGEKLQYRNPNAIEWRDYKENGIAGPWHCSPDVEWRVKPTIRYIAVFAHSEPEFFETEEEANEAKGECGIHVLKVEWTNEKWQVCK